MGAPTPPLIPAPFAADAAPANITFPIPTAPSGPSNSASWEDGFPAITMQPEIAGGLPPFGQDFNGVLFTITSGLYALQAGQFYGYDPSFVITLAGYNVGALLAMADGSGLWMNVTAANETNPDADATAAGWIPGISYGKTTLNGLIGGTVTLAPSQARKPLIILNGALSSNLTIVLPPWLTTWLITNNTTGAFTTTVKTAGGTGVVVPQGGPQSPTGVYSDGVSIYANSTPLTVAISQAATALTIVERDNLAQGWFTRVNLSSSYTENPAIGSILVQNSGHDGYSRWASFGYFQTQILVNADLTGIPTCPTAPAGTSNSQVASTAFVNPGPISGNAAAWTRKNPDGSIEQGGSFFYGGSLATETFPFNEPFPTAVVNITFTSSVGGFTPGWNSNTLAGFTAQFNGMGGTAQTCYWRAIGY